MKKILSFLILSAFFIIGFIHNSMMTFAVDNNLKVEMTDSQLCCDYDD
jgi:hypothetical protein